MVSRIRPSYTQSLLVDSFHEAHTEAPTYVILSCVKPLLIPTGTECNDVKGCCFCPKNSSWKQQLLRASRHISSTTLNGKKPPVVSYFTERERRQIRKASLVDIPASWPNHALIFLFGPCQMTIFAEDNSNVTTRIRFL